MKDKTKTKAYQKIPRMKYGHWSNEGLKMVNSKTIVELAFISHSRVSVNQIFYPFDISSNTSSTDISKA